MVKNTPIPRYVVVRRGPDRSRLVWTLVGLGWLLSVLGAWTFASWQASPLLPGLSATLKQTRAQLRAAQEELAQLHQHQATLARSDQISRAANRKVQQALAERDEEIADLRANLAFYERVAGSSAEPKGLNVHSAEFEPEAAGSWRYRIMLTQNLERGAVSTGKLRFSIEGVRDGKLTRLDWSDLHQRDAPEQEFSFRYFQQLRGRVMLPEGFTPQRVRVSLRGGDASLDQALAWVQPSASGDT